MGTSMARIADPLADIETGHAPAAVAADARENVLIPKIHVGGVAGLVRALRRPC
jgi:hypothetical protein